MRDVLTDIIAAFKESLENIKWMDKKSAKAAKEKVRHSITRYIEDATDCIPSFQANAIRVKVGYPISPDTESAQSIARYYSQVNINETDFLGNILSSSYVPFLLPHAFAQDLMFYILCIVQATNSRPGCNWVEDGTRRRGRCILPP